MKTRQSEEPDRSLWMLLNRGRVQWYSTGTLAGVVFAENHLTACRFAKKMGVKASPALVGSIQGESLSSVLESSLQAGANAVFMVDDNLRLKGMAF